MIIKFNRILQAALPCVFPGILLLFLPVFPAHATPLYTPPAGSMRSAAHGFEAFGAAAALFTFILAWSMERKAKQRLREGDYWRAFLEHVPHECALFDRDGRCLEILSRVGMPLEEGKRLQDALPPESTGKILEAIRHTIETEKPGDFEFALENGWYEGYALPVEGKALCVCRDITSAKQQERSLLSEKSSLQSILQSIGNGVITTDFLGCVTHINPTAERLTGWTVEKARGRPLSEVFRIIVEASREEAENPALAAMRENGIIAPRKSLLLVGKDGSEISIDETAAPIVDEAGQLSGAVIAFHDISDNQHLLWQAGHDALTGLLNRVLLHDRLMHSMASVKRQNKLLAVLFIDLDGFKSVNDQLGHAAGDSLLKEVAARLNKAVRAEDTVARIGGDEFVVLQEASDRHEVKSCLDRIMGTINSPFLIEDMPVSVSTSIGVALYPENEAEPETLLRQADMAMYHAKQSGRDQYHFFDARMDVMARKNLERQTRIASALKGGEFRLYYQPKIHLKSGRITGLEALIRWIDPDLGMTVLPRDFLPAVQDTQLIVEIGTWVINQALEQISAWQAQGIAMDVSINIAGRQLHDPDFADMLKAAFAAHPEISPSRIELEILETTAIADFRLVQEVLSSCREIGVRFSLDDFGTGYSSLSYLKNLPVDRLKIDQTFVAGMLENSDNLAIIRGIVSLSRIFNREVIAEGLESREQGEMLISMGCKQGQGYGIAEPMPGDAVPEWLGRWLQTPEWMANIH